MGRFQYGWYVFFPTDCHHVDAIHHALQLTNDISRYVDGRLSGVGGRVNARHQCNRNVDAGHFLVQKTGHLRRLQGDDAR